MSDLKLSDLEWVTNGDTFNYAHMRQHIRGRPMATGRYTADELEAMNIVGWYKRKGLTETK